MTRRNGNIMIFTSTSSKSKPYIYNPSITQVEPTKHNKIEKIPKKKNMNIIIR